MYLEDFGVLAVSIDDRPSINTKTSSDQQLQNQLTLLATTRFLSRVVGDGQGAQDEQSVFVKEVRGIGSEGGGSVGVHPFPFVFPKLEHHLRPRQQSASHAHPNTPPVSLHSPLSQRPHTISPRPDPAVGPHGRT